MEIGNGMYYSLLAQRAVEDDDAFTELYEYFFPRVYNFVFSRLKNGAEADDVTSVTFQKMYENLGRYDPGKAAFSTWLFRIATNAITDRVRFRPRNKEAEWEDFFDPAGPDSEKPETRMLASESKEELLLAIGKLSEREQRIIALKYWSGLGNKEIAEIMGLNYSNVGTILSRALKVLRKDLEKGE